MAINLEILFSYDIPVNNRDLLLLQNILRERDIIRSVFTQSQFDQYSFLEYRMQSRFHRTQFCAMLDRNILSDIIAIIKGEPGEVSETQRAACALLAFLQVTNTIIEPGHAIYEYIDSGHYDFAENEQKLFRKADNVSPEFYAEIALGRSSRIPEKELEYTEEELPLKNMRGEEHNCWKLIYGVVLKMAILEREHKHNLDKIILLLEWMYSDYLFIPPCVIFAVIYFSGNRFSKMLKHVKSEKSDKIKRGVRNATWDMNLLYNWMQNVHTQKKKNQIWLLCTEDKAVKEISQYIVWVVSRMFRTFCYSLFKGHG